MQTNKQKAFQSVTELEGFCSQPNRKAIQDWGSCFVTGKAENADGLAPFKDARRKTGRQGVLVSY